MPPRGANHQRLSASPPARYPPDFYRLRLYIAGACLRLTLALVSIKALCEERLPGRYDLEVIDIYQQPELLQRDQIVAAPTLVRLAPLPVRHFSGDLSDTSRLLLDLDLED
jgi:circadian clock protein KaiB